MAGKQEEKGIETGQMTPLINRKLAPPFHELGDKVFQDLCRGLLRELSGSPTTSTYGTRGQAQFGVDVFAQIEDGTLWAGDAKSYKVFEKKHLSPPLEKLMENLNGWKERGLSRFILFVASVVEDRHVHDELVGWITRFADEGIKLELWDGNEISKQLRQFPYIVEKFIDGCEYWLSHICGIQMQPKAFRENPGNDEVIVEVSVLEEVFEYKKDELEKVRMVLCEGRLNDAEELLEKIRRSSSWQQLPLDLRTTALKMRLGVVLERRDDVEMAKELLSELQDLAPEARVCHQEALIAMREGGFDSALEVLGDPENKEEWHLKIGLQINSGEFKEALSIIDTQMFLETDETLRLKALSHLFLRHPLQARLAIEEALKIAPESQRVKEAAARIYYFSAVHLLVPGWGGGKLPLPLDWDFIKQDSESRGFLKRAEIFFAEFAAYEGLRGGKLLEAMVWQLASLTNDRDRQGEGQILFDKICSEFPLSSQALSIAIQRKLSLDVSEILSRWESLLAEDPSPEVLQTVILLSCSMKRYEGLSDLVRKHRSEFDCSEDQPEWLFQEAQILALEGKSSEALKILDKLPSEANGGRSHILALLGQAVGWSPDILSRLDQEASKKGASDSLLTSCRAHHDADKSSYVIPHIESLLKAFPEESILRFVFDAALVAQEWDTVIDVSEKYQSIFADGQLPEDITRLRSRCFHRLQMSAQALGELEKIPENHRTAEDDLIAFGHQLARGNPGGAGEIARKISRSADVGPERLIYLASKLSPDEPELALQMFKQAEDLGIKDPETASSAVQLASRHGLADKMKELMTLAMKPGRSGVAPMKPISISELQKLLQSGHQASLSEDSVYRRGEIPLHLLNRSASGTLSRQFYVEWGDDSIGLNDRFPLRLIHGARSVTVDSDRQLSESGLILDITSVLFLDRFQIFDDVIGCFEKVVISSSLITWLQEEISSIDSHQPGQILSMQKVIDLVDKRQIAVLTRASANDSRLNKEAVAQMGLPWEELRAEIGRQGGLLVEKFPLTQNGGLEALGKPAKLSDLVLSTVVDISVLANDLERLGLLTGEQMESLSAGANRKIVDEGQDKSQIEEALILHAYPSPKAKLVLSDSLVDSVPEKTVIETLSKVSDLFISQGKIDEYRSRLMGNQSRLKLIGRLKELRAYLRTQIDLGKIVEAASSRPEPSPTDNELPSSLLDRCVRDSLEMDLDGNYCLNADDRYLTSYQTAGIRSISCSSELLRLLYRRGKIEEKDYLRIRQSMRQLNVRYLELEVEELLFHLGAAKVREGLLFDTVDLRILRNYLAACFQDLDDIRLSNFKKGNNEIIPEITFFTSVWSTLNKALFKIWKSPDSSFEERVARSDWIILNLWFDPGILRPAGGNDEVSEWDSHDVFVSMLFFAETEVDDASRLDEFNSWLFGRLGSEVCKWKPAMTRTLKSLASEEHRARQEEAGLNLSEDKAGLVLVWSWDGLLKKLPESLAEQMGIDLLDKELVQGTIGQRWSIGEYTFEADRLISACERVLKGAAVEIQESGGNRESFQIRYHGDGGANPSPKFELQRLRDGELKEGDEIMLVSDLELAMTLPSIKERLDVLARTRRQFDLPQSGAKSLFEEVAALGNSHDRVRRIQRMRDESVCLQMAEIARVIRRTRQFSLAEGRPLTTEHLLRHLRLPELKDWRGLGTVIKKGAKQLIKDVGFDYAFRRYATLPFPLPEGFTEEYRRLPKVERHRFIEQLDPSRLISTSKCHLVELLSKGFGEDRKLALQLLPELADEDQRRSLNLYGQVARWSLAWIRNCNSYGEVGPGDLIAAYLHAGLLQQITEVGSHAVNPSDDFATEYPQIKLWKYLSDDFQRYSQWEPDRFKALTYQLATISRVLPVLKPGKVVVAKLDQNLLPHCFPYPTATKLPALNLNLLDQSCYCCRSGLTPLVKILDLKPLYGGRLSALIGKGASTKEIGTSFSILKKDLLSASGWSMLLFLLGGRPPQKRYVNRIVKQINAVDFLELAKEPERFMQVGMLVMDLAKFAEIESLEEIDWIERFKDFEAGIRACYGKLDLERVANCFVGAAFALSSGRSQSFPEQVGIFVDLIELSEIEERDWKKGLHSKLLSLALNQSGSLSRPLWDLVQKLRCHF